MKMAIRGTSFFAVFILCIELFTLSGCSITSSSNKSSMAYISLVYTYSDTQETDPSKKIKTLFYIYDLANKQLKPIYSISGTSMYSTGIVDYKNSKVYYTMPANNHDTLQVDNEAGYKLISYDLKTHTTKDITGFHHEFKQLNLLNGKIIGIVKGSESNGNSQLSLIDPATGIVEPISPDDTDVVYRDYSIDHSTGEILTLTYSDFARRNENVGISTRTVLPCPYYLSVTDSKLSPPKVIYTFSRYIYYTEYGSSLHEDPQLTELALRTANNIEVKAASRMDDNNILVIAATSSLTNNATLKILHLDKKTVDDFPIAGVKYYSKPLATLDRKGMIMNLVMQDGTSGTYYYKFADKSLKLLFSLQDAQKGLPNTATHLNLIDMEFVVQ
ncbi:hypothetical protein [Coprothermobacter platensis]|uniref:hypothetical protein n=1 Tax=Coprothermobacter platensis TaxID=108819 RepID=UPI00037B1CF9|nr:hypothetical protein [Coprothermobacter platensis]